MTAVSGMVAASMLGGAEVGGGAPFEREGGGLAMVVVDGSDVVGRGWETCSLEMASIFANRVLLSSYENAEMRLEDEGDD